MGKLPLIEANKASAGARSKVAESGRQSGADVLVRVRANRVRAKQVATPFYKRVKK
jgi:hypothetical protein